MKNKFLRAETSQWRLLFDPYLLIDDGIIDLTDKGIGVRKSFLYWALQAPWKDYSIDEQKSYAKYPKINT